ncbi:hypothetical protein [Acidithiobacillus sulfuriphilus]|uniref:Type 4 fimbrial biogenesis protein PilX N-terminal domain-containing protein n=2 Tax=Acidithiobacillus sulfuriphilus TaxID=1867749 RepID=A0A3M8R6M7_9PROT|nr:hypothetical protein [Acidithiobacillus sulfuriphilus]RNF64213.1 hypothetical protein EC580_05970 [Acidithiobacillus sulfuriphilus]
MIANEGKRPSTPHPEKGSALVMVIFVMVVLALLLAALAYINAQSNQNTALQIASTRAYWAAQSGAEWGVYQVTSGNASTCSLPTQLPYSNYTPNAGLAGCAATVACLSSSASSTFYYQVNSTGVCAAGNLGVGNSPISATRSIVVGLATQNNCQGCTASCISNSCSPFFCSRNNLINCEKNNCSISPSNTNSCINTYCFFFGFCDTNGLGTCLAGYCPAAANGTAAATLSYWLESP